MGVFTDVAGKWVCSKAEVGFQVMGLAESIGRESQGCAPPPSYSCADSAACSLIPSGVPQEYLVTFKLEWMLKPKIEAIAMQCFGEYVQLVTSAVTEE